MLLAIDVGNSSVHFGLFEGKRLVKEWRCATKKPANKIRGSLSGHSYFGSWADKQNIRQIRVASVVPAADKIIKKLFPQAVFVNYRNIGIKVRVRKPSEVGADRLVNARAVKELYGGPAIIVDFGTATTFDVINAQGEYLGGVIAPGILMARDALHKKTAKLPQIAIKAPRSVIGKDTVSAMQSGLVLGYAALVEGIIARMKTELTPLPPLFKREGGASSVLAGVSLKVIATGGLARLICKYTDAIDRIDSQLTLKGLMLICQKS